MSFQYKNNELYLVQGGVEVSLKELAQKIKTPFYVYDLDGLLKRLKFFKEQTAPAKVFYAMKALSHPLLLETFLKEGVGLDIVSGGELDLALKAGFKGKDIIFSGVGKTKEEIHKALEADICQFNVESASELERIGFLAKSLNKTACLGFRINPNIQAHTHPYITTGLRENKFGIDEEEIPHLKNILSKYSKNLLFQGLTLHIGSQIRTFQPLKDSIQKMTALYNHLKKEFNLKTLDVGGGLGIDYEKDFSQISEDLKIIKEYGRCVKKLVSDTKALIFTEPGRIITARFACLIGEVQYIKKTPYKNFIILNTGMNHFMRPCLYQARHNIVPLRKTEGPSEVYDIAGPICESADILGRDRLFGSVKEGDFLAITDTGAYGSVLANTYNAHPLPKEIFISQGQPLNAAR